MDNEKEILKKDQVLAGSSGTKPKIVHDITIQSIQKPLASSTAERKYERKQRPPGSTRDSDEFELPNEKQFYPPVSQSSTLGILDLKKLTPLAEIEPSGLLRKEHGEIKLMTLLRETYGVTSLGKHSTGSTQSKSNSNTDERKSLSENINFNSPLRSSAISAKLRESLPDFSCRISMSDSLAKELNQYVEEDFCDLNPEFAEQIQPEKPSLPMSAPPIPNFSSSDEKLFQDDLLDELEESTNTVSFSDYCKQKSENYGNLDDTYSRTSLGLEPNAPVKKIASPKISNISKTSRVSNKDAKIVSVNVNGNNPMHLLNLANIANILNHEDNTPRSVVDQLLKLPKKPLTKHIRDQRLSSEPYFSENLGERQKKINVLENDRGSSGTFIVKAKDDEISEKANSSSTLKDAGASARNSDSEIQMLKKIQVHTNLHPEHKNEETIQRNLALERNVEIGNKSHEVVNCLLGIRTDSKIDIVNKGSKWILVSTSLLYMQGDKNNIELEIPHNTVLMEPNKGTSIKICAKMFELSKPIITTIKLSLTDMVTRDQWQILHVMCFIPEKINIKLPSFNNLTFGEITENGVKSQKIVIENLNNIDMSAEFKIEQNENSIFCISESEFRNFFKMELPSKESTSINVEFHGISLRSLADVDRKSESSMVYHARSSLLVTIFKDFETIIEKKITLVGSIGTIEVNLCDVQLPIIVHLNETTIICLRNSGSVATSVKVAITTNNREDNNFRVAPKNCTLKPGEKNSFFVTYSPNNSEKRESQSLLVITTESGVKTYPVIGENKISKRNVDIEHRYENSLKNSTVTNGSVDSTSSSMKKKYIPIRATCPTLVWGSVKANKRSIKELSIRNVSENKLKLVASIEATDQCFKFCRDGFGSCSNVAFTLYGNECKTFVIAFEPQHTGALFGKIIFQYYSRNQSADSATKIIQLNGYCGHGSIEIPCAFKDMSNQMWINLGYLDNVGSLDAKIEMRNNGDLTCYASLNFIPKSKNLSKSTWQIMPQEFLLEPREKRSISINFKPKKYDLSALKSRDVVHIGTLKILHGEEPTRMRIRRICNYLEGKGLLTSLDVSLKDLVTPLLKAFPNEKIISDLAILKDSSVNLNDLCNEIREYELRLTMSLRTEETIIIMDDSIDTTYHSLFNDTNDITLIPQNYEPHN